MSKQMEVRNYSLADADLKQQADDLRGTISRDSDVFATRNIGPVQMANFDGMIDAFDNTSTDVELQGEVTVAVEKKEMLVFDIQKSIRQIRNMADLAFTGKGRYNTFGFNDMTRLADNDLYRMATRVVRVGTSLTPELTAQGLTPTQLPELKTMAMQLDQKIDEVNHAYEQRDLETQARIRTGNILWEEMGRLASIGQTLFADTDEARYNDYVLSSGKPVAVVPAPSV